ncbi:vesicle-associated membrane protein, putative [Leishmania tarentolae]|uniref:Vesicle-associated membrane protein, putative n=1 Tax=Leishmania tarentolae TaxID=5689 RepID=A0A640KWT1_LEITA|nr:vesicle-associated membrane protein, putative [Leishmania tarentolae]GET93818.1 vesicle-associated membrane protein, putative [Leishmania tarentolae]
MRSDRVALLLGLNGGVKKRFDASLLLIGTFFTPTLSVTVQFFLSVPVSLVSYVCLAAIAMPINCSLVVFERVIIAEESVSPSVRVALQKMLGLLPCHDAKVSYQLERDVFHFFIESDIIFACTTSGHYENRIVFGFLLHIKDAFKRSFAGRADCYPRHTDLTPENCQDFSSTLASSRKTFNEGREEDKVERIKEQLNTTREVMLRNLDSIIERGDHIDTLCDRTELLRDEAQGFHSNARSLNHTVLLQKLSIVIGLAISLAVLALIIAFAICGINFQKC